MFSSGSLGTGTAEKRKEQRFSQVGVNWLAAPATLAAGAGMQPWAAGVGTMQQTERNCTPGAGEQRWAPLGIGSKPHLTGPPLKPGRAAASARHQDAPSPVSPGPHTGRGGRGGMASCFSTHWPFVGKGIQKGFGTVLRTESELSFKTRQGKGKTASKLEEKQSHNCEMNHKLKAVMFLFC